MTRICLSGWISLLAMLVCSGIGACLAAPVAPPMGKSSFVFADRRGEPSRPVTVWMFVPDGCTSACPLQFVMHGVKRNGEHHLDRAVELAKVAHFIVVAPEFSRAVFPKDEDYSLGRSLSEADPEKWAFAVPEHLFDELRAKFGFSAATYRLFGHSAGGQFVHRLHLFYPNHRAQPIIAANPGWYTQLEWSGSAKGYRFPYNTAGSKVDAARACNALSREFTLMLGDADVDANPPSLNNSAGAIAQGRDRLTKGNAFFDNAQAAALALKCEFKWRKLIIPGVAHDGAGMLSAALRYTKSDRQ